MFKIVSVVSMSVFIAACSSTAEVNSDKSKLAANDPDKVVCEVIKPTGSRLGKKLCMTQRQRDELRKRAQQNLDKVTQPQTNNPSSG